MTTPLLQDVRQPIGWNINPLDVSEHVFLAHVEGTKCHSHTVLHSLGFARKVYDISARTTGLRPVIVFREDDKDANVDASRYRDLRAYARKFKTTEDYWDDAYIYVWNEPPAGGDKARAAHILRRSIEACEAFADEGVKAVIGNFPCSDLYENYGDKKWIDEGLFDEALRVWSQWTNAGHGYIGEHGWYTFGLWSWTAGRNPFDMENPGLVTEDRWPTPDEVITSPDNWLNGRPLSTTYARCKVLGIEPYLSIGTEGGADWMPNAEIEGWAWSIQHALGIDVFKRDGILKQRDMLAVMMRTDEATAVIKNIRWLARLIRRARFVQAIHLFTLSKNSRWVNYDYSNWPEFWEPFYGLVEELRGTPPVSTPTVPPPTTGGKPATLVKVPLQFVNVREQPRGTSRDLGDLYPGTNVIYYPEAVANGHVYIEAVDVTPPLTGWVSLQNGAVVFAEDDPDAPPFVLGAPVAFAWRYSDRFDAPRNYQHIAPNKLQKHEGVDIIPQPGVSGPYPVIAAQTGVVESVGYDEKGYGHYVRVRHDWHGQTYKTWYAHLKAGSIPASVKNGAQVTIGAPIGEMGASGYVSGPHLHFTLQHIGRGLAGYVVDDVVDPEPYLPPPGAVPGPEPPLVEIQFADGAEKARFVKLHREIANAIEHAPGLLLKLDVRVE